MNEIEEKKQKMWQMVPQTVHQRGLTPHLRWCRRWYHRGVWHHTSDGATDVSPEGSDTTPQMVPQTVHQRGLAPHLRWCHRPYTRGVWHHTSDGAADVSPEGSGTTLLMYTAKLFAMFRGEFVGAYYPREFRED